MAALIRLAVVFSGEVTVLRGQANSKQGQIKTLQEQNKKLNKDLKDATTKKIERERLAKLQQEVQAVVQPSRSIPSGFVGGRDDIVQAIYAKFGERPEIITLVMCESGLRETAISPNGDYGLFQVKASAHPQYPTATLLSVQGNIDAAWDISNGGTNWGPWPQCGVRAGLL